MTGKHTPGPWLYQAGVEENEGEHYVCHPQTVCDVTTVCNPRTAFDARLIAAAPDLLDALEEASDPINGYLHGPVLARARAAIAKARGQE